VYGLGDTQWRPKALKERMGSLSPTFASSAGLRHAKQQEVLSGAFDIIY